MGLKTAPMNVRLPGVLGERFEALRREFAGLPPSVLLRMLVADQLERPLSEQAEIVIRQIRKPVGQTAR